MSDDWVKQYIQDRTNKQRKADMTAAGAPAIFQKIQDRIKQDIQIFHDNNLFPTLQAGWEVAKNRFVVTASDPLPQSSLRMNLNVVLIAYLYVFEEHGRDVPHQDGALKVCSDLDGNLQVYRDGKLLGIESDVSEVSEFLLRPLLNHING